VTAFCATSELLIGLMFAAERMVRIGNAKQLQVVNNTNQSPIPMLIQPRSEMWGWRGGQAIEDQFTWVVALDATQAEPDLQPGDVITGYRGKKLEMRSVNRYEGPYPYLGGILTAYSHKA
jgi:hypothetical protein